jgi:hypothetical protein
MIINFERRLPANARPISGTGEREKLSLTKAGLDRGGLLRNPGKPPVHAGSRGVGKALRFSSLPPASSKCVGAVEDRIKDGCRVSEGVSKGTVSDSDAARD